MRTLISWAGLVVTLSLILATARGVDAVSNDECTVVTCENGEVFCSPGSLIEEFPPDPKKIACKGVVLTARCSELPECGRRVPTMSVVGLSSLGLAMIAGGAALLRLRRRNP